MKYLKKFEAIVRKYDIDVILNSYISCMLWTEEEPLFLDENGEYSNPDDIVVSEDMISEDDKYEMKKEIKWFIELAGDTINYVTDDMLGYDLWLTRNGHGAGFFDRDLPKHVLDTFEELCDILGTVDLYLGDDGNLHYISSDNYKKIDIQKFKEERKLKKDVSTYNL